MLTQINENTVSISIFTISLLILIIALLTIIIFVGLFTFIIPIRKKIDEMNRIMFFILKKDEKYDNSHTDIKHALSIINSNIGSLSSSTSQLIEEIEMTINNRSDFPTPNVSKLIRETILENIKMEVLLSQGMKLPNKQSTRHIIDNTINTYPNINKEYMVKLCMAMIENFTLSSDDKK